MPVFTIGIAGPSGSGKSTLTERLVERLADRAAVLGLDGYYKEPAVVEQLPYRHDHPDAVDLDAVLDDLRALQAGRNVHVPVYSYQIHRRSGTRPQPARPVIIVEGLYVFHRPELREALDYRIWVDVSQEQQVARRMNRDQGAERGRTSGEVEERMRTDVLPAFELFGEPCRNHADVSIRNEDPGLLEMHRLVDELLAHPRIQAILAS
jgi:uridine kinase